MYFDGLDNETIHSAAIQLYVLNDSINDTGVNEEYLTAFAEKCVLRYSSDICFIMCSLEEVPSGNNNVILVDHFPGDDTLYYNVS